MKTFVSFLSSRSLQITFLVLFATIIISGITLSNDISIYGHAIPDRYSLEPNSVVRNLESFPTNITILFSERPDPKISYIHVTDSDGKRVDNDDIRINPQNDREASITLSPKLIKDGVYSISWLTFSFDDGHVAKGTYVVGVGDLSGKGTASENDSQHEEQFSPILAAIKTPIIIGEVCILGFVFSQLYFWRDFNRIGLTPAIHLLSKDRVRTIIITSSIVMMVLSTTYLLFQTAVITENNSSYFDYLLVLLFQTNNGIVWIIRVICCIVLLFSVHFYSKTSSNSKGEIHASRRREATLLWIMLAIIAFFIVVNSSVSHSSSIQSWSLIGISADFVHTVIVSIWIGGLAYISYVFFPNIQSLTNLISGKVQKASIQQKSIELLIIGKFSILATISIAIISITGLFLGWLHIHTIDELLVSDYGRTLIVKLSIALPVIAFGGYHQFWINRISKMRKGEKNNGEKRFVRKAGLKLPESLKSTIRIETVLMLLVLAVASLLTVTSPPSQDHQMINAGMSDMQESSDMNSNFNQVFEVQGVPIGLRISPFVVGFNNFTINFLEQDQNFSDISRVFIEFKKADLSLGAINAQLQKSNDTTYSSFGGYLSQPGSWDLKITVQRTGSYDVIYRLGLTVNNSNPAMEHAIHNTTGSVDEKTDNIESDFTLMVVVLSIVITIASTVLCITARKRLAALHNELNLRE